MIHYVLPETKARIEYDKDVRGLYVSVAGPNAAGSAAKTVTANDDPLVNLDYDSAGRLIGVEILLPT